jgi:formiminotetrahydrofolate cyclodeaminase
MKMIVDRLKKIKKEYQKSGKKKYKGEIETLSKAIKLIKKLEEEVQYLEKQKQESLFDTLDNS